MTDTDKQNNTNTFIERQHADVAKDDVCSVFERFLTVFGMQVFNHF